VLNKVISIKDTIARLDVHEQRFQTAFSCYLAAISAIGEHAVEVAPELTRENRHSLQVLHSELSGNPAAETLTASRATLISTLEDYKSKAAAVITGREGDLRAMMSSLAEVAKTLAGHNDLHSQRLNRFTQQLQTVARGTDLASMRRELAEAVVELKSTQAEMSRDHDGLVLDIREQLVTFQQRLERTESRAYGDSLTGLLNRGEGEARLVARLAAGLPFSVILVDLNDFKQINDQYGHVSGDQVLRTVAHILTSCLRTSDMVCRWGGDEFLLLIAGDKAVADQRALRLYDQLKVRCKLVSLREMYDVDISACLGVSQARAGDTVDDLVVRADMDLYRQKKEHKDRLTLIPTYDKEGAVPANVETGQE
jgi:diguanylate cyclase (GGDEF)-like protein